MPTKFAQNQPPQVCVIVSTYRQPDFLDRCLCALEKQTWSSFEIAIADDGSGDETRAVIEDHSKRSANRIRHVWQEDDGFRKTLILNKAILATQAEYLVFMDGDCIAHPGFIAEHVKASEPGHYVNGSLIRLGEAVSDRITRDAIESGDAFRASWLSRQGDGFNRRYLRLSLSYGMRCWLNRRSSTKLYWLGSNSSCYRADAVTVNGFDHRFTYGFEDGDYGYRLENYGLVPKTVRWTAVVLHLWHGRPWSNPEVLEQNRALMVEKKPGGRHRAIVGLEELQG